MNKTLKPIFFIAGCFALIFACSKPSGVDTPRWEIPDKDTTAVDTTIVNPVDTTVVDPKDTTVVNPKDTTVVTPSDSIVAPSLTAVADIADIEFLPDGTARNLVSGGMVCQTIPGSSMCTYYNPDYGRYAAHFNVYPAGTNMASGYFKLDYTNRKAVKNALSDGHTLELVLRLDCVPDGTLEIKAMCSQQSGGTGIMISASGQGRNITFLPNVSTTGSSNWCWTKSGIVPAAGRYYHVVGVWDKTAGKSYIYVDGVLKSTANASGNFVLPTSGATWFCIGGDPASSKDASSGWWGDIVMARIYDGPVEAEKIPQLYEDAKPKVKDHFVVSNIEFLSTAKVKAGCKYNVFANGLAESDFIRFYTDSGTFFDCTTQFGSDHLSAIIPNNLREGTYTLAVVRGQAVYPVGRVAFTLSSDLSAIGSVKCIAHRGYHPNNSYPENSIAALKYAQQLGCFGAEFDVWKTTDGELYINHDGTLGGVTIANATSGQVAGLKLANGENIPTLRQYLAQGKLYPDTRMVLELKHAAATDASVALVKEMKMEGQVDWIAFDYSALKSVKKQIPTAKVYYLGGDKSPQVLAADGISGFSYAFTSMTLHMDWIQQARDLGLESCVWTVDTDFDYWISSGVDMITTNQAEKLMSVLKRSFVEE